MSFTGYQAQCLLARLTLTVIQFKGNISNPTMASAISVRAQALLQFLGGCSRRSHQYVIVSFGDLHIYVYHIWNDTHLVIRR